MANSNAKTGGPSSRNANRNLVVFLVVAIICVLALGVWLLTGRDQPSSTDESPSVTDVSQDIFYMPAEFDPQEFLILGGEQLAAQNPDLMVDIVRAVHRVVRVIILASQAQGRQFIDSVLIAGGLDRIHVETLPFSEISMWVRDYGPLTVTDPQGRRSMVEFKYKGVRGVRYDNDVPEILSMQLELVLLGNDLQIEGGDLVANGQGFGVVSTRVVDRNEGYQDKGTEGIAQDIAALLGFETVMLVPPLVDESTGHVDRFFTFLAPDLAVVGSMAAAADAENADQLDKIAKDLEGMPTALGPLRVERIPQPDHADGLWRSYTSLVFANGVVLVPVYPDYCPDLDEQALAVYRRLLPDRKVVAIDASSLIRLNGTLRGITLNVPVGGPTESP